MSATFYGRVAIISGGAGGVGLATARRLRAGGAEVTLWDIDEEALAKARVEFGMKSRVVTDRVDVTDATDVARAASQVVGRFGKLDILVASAGITGPTETVWEYPLEAWS